MTVEPGRRARAKSDKRERILTAARAVFAETGVDAATTARIASLAGISHGTLFLYAATKGELVLMAGNAAVAAAIRVGVEAAARQRDPRECISALLRPLVAEPGAIAFLAAYQRHLLDPAGAGEHLEAALALVRETELALTTILTAAWTGPSPAPSASDAARAIAAVIDVELLRAGRTGAGAEHFVAEVLAQADVIVRGYLTTAAPRTAHPHGAPNPEGQTSP